MNNLVARFVLTLQDRLSGPLAAVRRRIEALRQVAGRVAVVGTALAGLSVAGPVRQAAALDNVLRQNAVTARMTGEELDRAIASNMDSYAALSREVLQSRMDIARTAGALASAGIAEADVARLLPQIGRAATASATAMADLGQSGIALNQNLRIPVDRLYSAFARMFEAGREGRFELRDMAAGFPEITAAAQRMGYAGEQGLGNLLAMLQVARRGTATGADAVNNMRNFMTAVFSPDVLRNFQEAGVNIRDVLTRARQEGKDPIEAVLWQIRNITGDDAQKISDLFGDQHAGAFITSMLANLEEYTRLRRELRDPGTGGLDAAFADMSRGPEQQLKRLGEIATQLGDRIGTALNTMLGPILIRAEQLLAWIQQLDGDFPGLIDNVVIGTGAFIALSAALAGIGLVAGPLKAALAVLAAPFVLLGAAVVGVAYYIYSQWERFSSFFEAMGQGLSNIVSGFVENISGLLTGDFARGAEGSMMIWRGIEGFFSGLWGGLRTLFEDFAAWVDGWTGGAVSNAAQAVSTAWAALLDWFDQLWTSVRAPFEGFATWLDGWTGGAASNAARAVTTAWNDLLGWFDQLWASVRAPFEGFATWLDGWTGGAASIASRAVTAAWNDLLGWFDQLWASLRAPFEGFATWLDGWTGGAVTASIEALRAAFRGLSGFFEGLWATIRAPFDSFIGGVTSAIERVQALVGSVRSGVAAGQEAQARLDAAPRAMGSVQERQAAARAGIGSGFYAPADAAAAAAGGGPAQRTTVGGEIVVRAAPGTEVVQAQGTNPEVPVTTGARGQTRGRP